MDFGGQTHCADAWASPARVHSGDDRPAAEYGEMYVFGSLVVVVTSANTMLVVVVADMASIRRRQREHAPPMGVRR
jgi:hypothetical protein